LSDIFLGEASSKEQESFARFQRLATSAETAAALLEQVFATTFATSCHS
jgi:hypothetical protein